MPVSPLYWPLSTLAFATTGLLVSGGVYFALRALENWDKPSAQFLNTLGTWGIVAGMGYFALPLLLLAVPISVVLAILGTRFHQKSQGNSESYGDAFSLMMMTALLTISIQCFLWVCFAPLILPYYPPLSRTPELIVAHCFLLLAPVALMPFLVWAYQKSRLRPGIDRHLNKGEENSMEPIA